MKTEYKLNSLRAEEAETEVQTKEEEIDKMRMLRLK